MTTIGTCVAGRYEIRDILGQGAQGRVLEAFDHHLGRLVALKILSLGGVSAEDRAERRDRFLTESRAAARLQHAGIVAVHDSGETGDDAWIAMELVIGQTLREAMRREGRLPVPEALRIGRELLAALDAAHARGVIHRDVKSCNIMLAMDGSGDLGRVRLTDFGIATLATRQKPADLEFVGTPAVMAPEQIRGEACDERTDLWAAGVVLYELLTGAAPFAGAVPAIYSAVLARDPLPVTLLNPELPAAFDGLMRKALAKAVDERFQSAGEFAAAIDAAAGNPAAEAAAAPVVAAVSPHRRLHPALAFLAGAATAFMGFAARDAGWLSAVVAARPPPVASAATVATTSASDDAGEPATAAPVRDEAGDHAQSAMQPPTTEAAAPTLAQDDAAEPPVAASIANPAQPEPETEPSLPEADSPSAVAPTEAAAPVMAAKPMPLPAEASPAPAPAGVASPGMEEQPPQAAEAGPPAPAVIPQDIVAPSEPGCIGDPPQIATGDHPGFGRLVLRWTRPVRYSATPVPGGLRLAFEQPYCIMADAAARMPRNVRAVRGAPGRFDIEVAPGSTIRHFTLDRRTVIDIADARPR